VENSIIASVSFVATRQFYVKKRGDKITEYKLNLNHVDLLLMKGDLQKNTQTLCSKEIYKKVSKSENNFNI